jgi:ribonuclease T2
MLSFFSPSQIPLLSSVLGLFGQTDHRPQQTLGPSVLSQCPLPPALSCPALPPHDGVDTCCVNHPSGHFLQTQFWDTSPALGPDDSWTIHGLWPDLCAGGFDQFCDGSRTHDDIRALLGTGELLDYMDRFWLGLNGDSNHLWAHEWNKHGTCISTLEPDCFDDTDEQNLAVRDYFVHATSLFRTLDTFATLAEAGIVPSPSQRYTLGELESAIESSPHGLPVTFRCNRAGELDEVWYHFSVMGSLRIDHGADNDAGAFLNATAVRQTFIPTDPDGILSNCPRQGIKYLPKSSAGDPDPSPTRTHTTPSSPTKTPTSPPFTGKGHLAVHVVDSSKQTLESPSSQTTSPQKGCLIRLGSWYLSGTCATYKAQRDVVDPGHAALFSLSSSFSPCAITPATGKFECTKSGAIQGIFASDPSDATVLSYQNKTTFYADHVPRRFEKVDVYADDGDGTRNVELEIHWVPV